MSVRHIEMTWRCSSCQHRNLGRRKRCHQCQHPKDRSEKYEMPADPAQAVSVTDADLLRMATAGPNWRCAYCGSDQRNADKSCAECGASSVEAEPMAAKSTPPRRPAKPRRWPLILGLVGATGTGGYLYSQRTRDFQATVEKVAWSQSIVVERYKIWNREGFRTELPGEAFDIRSQGQKIHHYDKVLDGYDTEYYTERIARRRDLPLRPRPAESAPRTARLRTCRPRHGGVACRPTTERAALAPGPATATSPYAEHAAYGSGRGVDRTSTPRRGRRLRWPARGQVGGTGEKEQERERRVAPRGHARYDEARRR